MIFPAFPLGILLRIVSGIAPGIPSGNPSEIFSRFLQNSFRDCFRNSAQDSPRDFFQHSSDNIPGTLARNIPREPENSSIVERAVQEVWENMLQGTESMYVNSNSLQNKIRVVNFLQLPKFLMRNYMLISRPCFKYFSS